MLQLLRRWVRGGPTQMSKTGTKKVFVVHPPLEKHQSAKTITYEFKNNDSYEKFMARHKAELKQESQEGAALHIDQLQDGGVYTMVGPFYAANQSDQLRHKVDDKVLEVEAAICIHKALGGGAHIHPNVKFTDQITNKIVMEVDAIVHNGSEDPTKAAVYVVQAAYAPQESEVAVIKGKIAAMKPFLQADPHFQGITRVIPVLAGRFWSTATIEACGPMLRVSPSGAGYQVHGRVAP